MTPIISRETGIDCEDHGTPIDSPGADWIESIIREESKMPTDELKTSSTRSYEVVKRQHTPDAFERQVRNAVSEVLAQ